VTGVLDADLGAAIQKIHTARTEGTITPETCRQHAARFSWEAALQIFEAAGQN